MEALCANALKWKIPKIQRKELIDPKRTEITQFLCRKEKTKTFQKAIEALGIP